MKRYSRTANLFDYQQGTPTAFKYLDASGQEITVSEVAPWYITDYIPIDVDTNIITLSMIGGGAPAMCAYGSNKNFLTGVQYNTGSAINKEPITITANENIKYIRFSYFLGNSGYDDLATKMLNTGSTALPYEPYGSTWQTKNPPRYGTATDTITNLPADLYADGNNATVGLVGNMVQSGTPTPQNPITPQETGDKTGNLFDSAILANNKTLDFSGNVIDSAGRIATTTPFNVSDYTSVTLSYTSNTSNSVSFMFATFNGSSLVERTAGKMSGTTIDVTNCNALYVSFYMSTSITTDDVSEIMLNTGSEALPYEPYGYKLDIKSASTTTPVYLGEVQSTRQIYKIVLTGQESWAEYGTGTGHFYYIALSPFAMMNLYPVCSHYTTVRVASEGKQLRIYENYESTTDFANYLQQQYAAETPVTVWYVLATPETGVVNEPIRKIGDYADTVSGISIPTITGADTFDVLTSLKPSEVSLTYTGWHDASVGEWDGSEWQ